MEQENRPTDEELSILINHLKIKELSILINHLKIKCVETTDNLEKQECTEIIKYLLDYLMMRNKLVTLLESLKSDM